MRRLAVVATVVVVAVCAACGSAIAPFGSPDQKAGAAPAADTYTPPAEGGVARAIGHRPAGR